MYEDSTVYHKEDGMMVPLEAGECPDFASISDISDFITKLGEALITILTPFVEDLKKIFGNLEHYQSYELLHPRKKPRGSIRRWKRSRR